MNVDDVPRLEGTGVILRDVRDGDAATRAALGRRREIVRGFGGDIAEDGPMTEEEATFELGHRFGRGPHWVIADHTDTFLGILRLAPSIDLHAQIPLHSDCSGNKFVLTLFRFA